MVAESVKSCCRPAPTSQPNVRPAEAETPVKPAPAAQAAPPHAATRALREAWVAVEEVGARLASTRPPYADAHAALTDGLDAAQYRRTYVQGCVCKSGVAGGGCCPAHGLGAAGAGGHAHRARASAASGARAAGAGEQAHGTCASAASGPQAAHLAMAGVGSALSLLGMASGVRVMQLSTDARSKLAAVAQATERQASTLAQREAAYAQHGALSRAAAHARAELSAAHGLLAALDASRQEQTFNFSILGVLQTLASAASGAAALAHAGLSVAAAGAAACAAGGLFGLYGAALAAKNFAAAAASVPPASLQEAPVPQDYRQAVQDHAHAGRRQQRRSGWAWASVAAASALGAAGALLSLPGGALITGFALGSAAWAMVESSRTRYAPHVPVSPHVAPSSLATPEQRAQVWTALQKQQRAIATAVARLGALQSRGVQARQALERHLRPQCGPKSFQVLPAAVQRQEAAGGEVSLYDGIQLDAAQAWTQAERDLLEAQYKAQHQELKARYAELRHLVDPCCKGKQAKARQALRLGQATERLYTQASTALRDEAHTLEHAARRLAALDLLDASLAALRPHAGHLSCSAGQPATRAQQDWIDARLLLMQLQGTLGDALPAALIREQPALFTQRSDALPLENVQVLPQALAEVGRFLAPRLDAAFLHAFFNPRRTEGELDYVLSREIAALSTTAAAATAPACTGKTCCA